MQVWSVVSWRPLVFPPLIAILSAVVLAVASSASAATVSEDVPVPGGTAALAQSLGFESVPERGRFIYEITRLLYNTPEGRKPTADAYLTAARQAAGRRRECRTRPGGGGTGAM